MKRFKEQELTEAQQILLCCYFDKECGYLRKLMAKRLLRSNPYARQYLDAIEATGTSCREAMKDASNPNVDLWTRIEARIVAEERAALFLGERRLEDTNSFSSTIWRKFAGSHALLGGISGAAVTAMTLFLVTRPPDQTQYGQPQYGTSFSDGQFTQTGATVGSVGGTQVRTRPVILNERSAPSAVEVDWMRANGPLRFIQNPGERSATIWVKRRYRQEGLSSRASVNATPTAPVGLSEGLEESLLYRNR